MYMLVLDMKSYSGAPKNIVNRVCNVRASLPSHRVGESAAHTPVLGMFVM